MSKQQSESLDALAEKIDAIPALSSVTDRIVDLVNDESTTVEDLEQAIRTDPGLSSRVLRFANARYYGHEGKVTAVKRAVNILGFKTVRSIALTYGMEEKYTAPELQSFPRNQFWLYSLGVALCSELIAEKLNYEDYRQGELFSAGHLHAVGKSILDQHLHRDFIRIMQKTKKDDVPMYQAEREVVGLTHCEIGEAVLRKWGLPSVIVDAAGQYYDPGEDASEEVIIVHLASVLTKTKGYGFSGDQYLGYLHEGKVDKLGLSDEEFERLLQEEYPGEFEDVKELVES